MGWGDTTLTGSPAQTQELTEMAQSPHTLSLSDFIHSQSARRHVRRCLPGGPRLTCIYSVEQHILAHGETTIATAAKRRGYRTFFAGKWHLGSLSNDSHTDCYRIFQVPASSATWLRQDVRPGGVQRVLFRQDGHLGISNPLYFGSTSLSPRRSAVPVLPPTAVGLLTGP